MQEAKKDTLPFKKSDLGAMVHMSAISHRRVKERVGERDWRVPANRQGQKGTPR